MAAVKVVKPGTVVTMKEDGKEWTVVSYDPQSFLYELKRVVVHNYFIILPKRKVEKTRAKRDWFVVKKGKKQNG